MGPMARGCLTEDDLVHLLAGSIGTAHADAVDEHIDRCPECLRLVSEMARALPSSSTSPPSVPAPLRMGTRVGRYRIEEMLGSGAMGVVYAAYDDELARRLAIKLVRSPGSSSTVHRARLLGEGRAIARVSHPNVVTVHDVGTFGEDVFIAMELVDGESLRDWLRREKRSRQEVVQILLGAARGLAAAHASGIVHRDFKPENVMVARNGRVVVADFGLARSARDHSGENAADAPEPGGDAPTADREATATGVVLGTPAYMAPEQRAGATADARSDQYAFCVVLHEALYGQRPVEGARVERAGGLTRLRRALARGLAVDPSDRHPSMAELVRALEPGPRADWLKMTALLLGLGAAGAVYALHRSSAQQRAECERDAAAVDAVWNERVAERARDAFGATRLPYAGTTWQATSRLVGAYAADLREARSHMCTERQRDLASDLLRRRDRCLSDQLVELTASVDALVHADAKVVEGALPMVHALEPVASCRDGKALSALAAPQDAAKVDAIKARLSRARVLERTGKFDEAHSLVEASLVDANATGHRHLKALAHFELGVTLSHRRDVDAEAEAFLTAATIADAAGDDVLRARALKKLLFVVGAKQRRHEAVPLVDGQLRAAIERLGGDDVLDAQRRSSLGVILKSRGRYAEAREELESALSLMRRVLPVGSDELAPILINLAGVNRRLSRYDAAVVALKEAEQLVTDTRGAESPLAAIVNNNVADLFVGQGKFEDALPPIERARAAVSHLPADAPERALVLETRAHVLAGLRRFDEARTEALEALAILDRRVGGDPAGLMPVLAILGSVEVDRGDLTRARAVLDRADGICARACEPNERASTTFARARLLDAAGDARGARALAGQAERLFRTVGNEHAAATVAGWVRGGATM